MKVLAITGDSDLPESNLLCELKKLGVDMHIVSPPSNPRLQLFKDAGINVTIAPLNSRFDITTIKILRGLIKTGGFDLIHGLTSRAMSNANIASFGFHAPILGYRGTIGHLSRWDPASWLTFFHPKLVGVSAVSEAVRQYFLSLNFPESRVRTIYKGHRISWYSKKPRTTLKDFGIPEDAFVICCVANMRRIKGADILIKAFDDLPAEDNSYLLLIGEVRDKRIRELLTQIKRKDRVKTPGFISSASSYAGACDLFVMPTTEREGFPKGVIEAMCQEVPVIVTKVGGMPELVDQASGLVVPPKNIGALRDAIQSCMTDRDLSRTKGQNARRRIETVFTVERTASETLSFYKELIETDRPTQAV